jgi:endoglucanase
LEILDWAVEQSLRNGLMTILDFHEFVTMGRDPLGNKDDFLAFWKRIGERYSNHPNEVVFELLNEPNGELTPELWNKLYMEAFNIVRKTTPERTIIVGPAYWNSIGHLDELKLPEEDENIIVTVHYYRSMEFTHQGAKWVDLEDKVRARGTYRTITRKEGRAVEGHSMDGFGALHLGLKFPNLFGAISAIAPSILVI